MHCKKIDCRILLNLSIIKGVDRMLELEQFKLEIEALEEELNEMGASL